MSISERVGIKSVLIIGGYGFVGRNLTELILEEPNTLVYIVDNFLSSDRNLMASDSRIIVVEGDAGDSANLEKIPHSINEIYILKFINFSNI
jgi:nucleoside-diphosphate-sugar epimerase